MVNPIAESWIYATMKIQNEQGSSGTGFLVARDIGDGLARIFLVTNKHVLHPEVEGRRSAKKAYLYINVKDENGQVCGQTITITLHDTSGEPMWREHADENVDVLAMDVTILDLNLPSFEHRWVQYGDVIDQAKIAEYEVCIGDSVIVIGYPSGYSQGSSNFPLVREGIISTRLGEPFVEEEQKLDGFTERRTYRGFLIDGATIPGSSGSPVVLKPVSGRNVKGSIQLGTPPALLLGIIAQTRFAFIGDTPSYAGLGLAFDAETIKETIELFFN